MVWASDMRHFVHIASTSPPTLWVAICVGSLWEGALAPFVNRGRHHTRDLPLGANTLTRPPDKSTRIVTPARRAVTEEALLRFRHSLLMSPTPKRRALDRPIRPTRAEV